MKKIGSQGQFDRRCFKGIKCKSLYNDNQRRQSTKLLVGQTT